MRERAGQGHSGGGSKICSFYDLHNIEGDLRFAQFMTYIYIEEDKICSIYNLHNMEGILDLLNL